MRFKDFDAFNLTLLAKQFWRLLTFPHSLVATIMNEKYFRHCTLLEAFVKNNFSWVWKSIIFAKEVLQKGIRWRVGNGSKIQI